jgi:NADH-quinone oxidoreductase subunit E
VSALPEPGETLSAQAWQRVDVEIAKYPPHEKRSAVVAALAIAQEEVGWLPGWAIESVAHYLGIPPIAAYEVATFYSMYDLQPVGRFKLALCTNLPCALSGATRAAARLKEKLGIGFGETSSDGLFTLKEGECFGACGDAPVLLVNDKRMCSFMSDERLDQLLHELREVGDRNQ